MAHINLLPWREELRRKRQRDFGGYLLAGALMTVLGVMGVHLTLGMMIDDQQRRNQFLRDEIAQLDLVIREIKDLEKTRENLLARMDVIQELQGSRPEIVHVFDELVATLPDGVHLTELEQQGRTLVLRGQAESNARVSNYMRRIEASAWIGDPDLKRIENKEGGAGALSEFELRAQQRSPSKESSG